MKWAEMKPYEQDELVHEHVMHGKCPCHALAGVGYITNSLYIWECGKCGANNTNSGGTYRDHDSQVLPHYTRSMDAAWEVLNKMSDMQTDSEHLGELTPQFEAFSDLLFEGWVQASTHGDLYPGYRIIEIAAAWTPESLCEAALQACGVDI